MWPIIIKFSVVIVLDKNVLVNDKNFLVDVCFILEMIYLRFLNHVEVCYI